MLEILLLASPLIVVTTAAWLIFYDLCRQVRHVPRHVLAEERRPSAAVRQRQW